MASQIGFKSDDNHQKMKTAIKEVDRAIQNIERYQYPYRLKNKVEKFKNIWSINRDFFNQKDASPLPYLLLASTKYGQNLLTDIEQYHKKNL
jgi:hypothetical protein